MGLLLLLTCWLRMYAHYLGEWVYLRGTHVPVYGFLPQLLTTLIKYTPQSTPVHIEIGIVATGVLANMSVFSVMGILSWVCQKLLGQFPNLGSRFIACYGISTILDPLLILAADLILHNYDCRSVEGCISDLASESCKYVFLYS